PVAGERRREGHRSGGAGRRAARTLRPARPARARRDRRRPPGRVERGRRRHGDRSDDSRRQGVRRGARASPRVVVCEEHMIRILVVDDHPLLREGIAALVGGQPDMTLVAECSNGREAIQAFRTYRPDVTLMDLQMPEMSGLDAIGAIRGEFPDARIIVLTTYSGDVQVLRALHAGARAYLLKNLVHKELLDTIRAVHAGKKTLSPQASYELAEHATDEALTAAEIDVL